MENEQTGLFDNMSDKEIEGFTKIGERIIDKIKPDDEKLQNDLSKELKEFNLPYLNIYNNGRKTGLYEGEKEGFWKGALTATAIIGLGYYLYNKNKNS